MRRFFTSLSLACTCLCTGLPAISWAGSYDDFFRAIHQNQVRPIQQLLEQGFEVNTTDPQGRTALHLALSEESYAVARLLLNWRPLDVNRPNLDNETPLMLAALKGQLELVQKMVERGAEVNRLGWAPLHYAASQSNTAVLQYLLDQHAYIDAEAPNGTTPLMMAAQYGSTEVVRLLLRAGADVNLKNKLGLSAHDFAIRGERPDAVRLLAEFGVTP